LSLMQIESQPISRTQRPLAANASTVCRGLMVLRDRALRVLAGLFHSGAMLVLRLRTSLSGSKILKTSIRWRRTSLQTAPRRCLHNAIAQQVLAAQQHLQPLLGISLRSVRNRSHGSSFRKADAGIEGCAAPALLPTSNGHWSMSCRPESMSSKAMRVASKL